MTESESYQLLVVALADAVPADIRMRRLLKTMLRRYRFRCRSVIRHDSKQAKTTDAGAEEARIRAAARLICQQVYGLKIDGEPLDKHNNCSPDETKEMALRD